MAGRRGLAQAAKLIRRTTLSNDEKLIRNTQNKIDTTSWNKAVNALVDRKLDNSKISWTGGDIASAILAQNQWTYKLAYSSSSPVQEKMTFFWSGILTSNRGVVGPHPELFIQHAHLMHRLAMSDFRTLLKAFVLDPVLQVFLDLSLIHI